MVKEGVLQQSALDPVDSYSSPEKQYELMALVLEIYHQGRDLLKLGTPVEQLSALPIMGKTRRLKSALGSEEIEQIRAFHEEIRATFDPIRSEYSAAKGKQA